MDDKVYTNEVIQENPFPGSDPQSVNITQNTQGGNYSSIKQKSQPFPKKRIATELLSTALNTKSKKVLQNFELADSGGFQVGNFKNGISGDLRITPAGLTARDSAGITTFAIDGETGDAVFKGSIQTGSVVSGEVEVSDEGALNLRSGADIFLNSKSDNQSQIVFIQEEEDTPIAVIYYDYDANEVKFKKPVGSQDIAFVFGSTTEPLQYLHVYGQDGVLMRAYSASLDHNYQLEITSTQIIGKYDNASKFKIDTSGNLFITGTITENWVP